MRFAHCSTGSLIQLCSALSVFIGESAVSSIAVVCLPPALFSLGVHVRHGILYMHHYISFPPGTKRRDGRACTLSCTCPTGSRRPDPPVKSDKVALLGKYEQATD